MTCATGARGNVASVTLEALASVSAWYYFSRQTGGCIVEATIPVTMPTARKSAGNLCQTGRLGRQAFHV